MNSTYRSLTFAAVVAAAAIGFSTTHPDDVFAQNQPAQSGPQHDHDQAAPPAATSRPMMRGGQVPMPGMSAPGGMAMKDDGRATALVKKMNEARGDAKVAAMAELLNVLVEERSAMQAHMADMQAHMAAMMMSQEAAPAK